MPARPHGTTRFPLEFFFREIWYMSIYRKSVENIHVSLKSDKNNVCFTWRRTNVYDSALSSLYNAKCFRQKFQRKSKHAFYDVRGSVHHSIIHIENPTRCNSVSKFHFIFIWSSTCFGRYTAHHQEPKTALAASAFAYVECCWTCSCWTLSGRIYLYSTLLCSTLYFTLHSTWQRPATTLPITLHVCKTRGC